MLAKTLSEFRAASVLAASTSRVDLLGGRGVADAVSSRSKSGSRLTPSRLGCSGVGSDIKLVIIRASSIYERGRCNCVGLVNQDRSRLI